MKLFPNGLAYCRRIITSYEIHKKIAIGLAVSLAATLSPPSYAEEPDSPDLSNIRIIEQYKDFSIFILKNSIQDIAGSPRIQFFTIFFAFRDNAATDMKVLQLYYLADCEEGKLGLFKTRTLYRNGEEKDSDAGDANDPFQVPTETYEKKSLTYVCLSRDWRK